MTSFDDYVREVEQEAEAEGPEAVRQLALFRNRHGFMAQLMERRLELGFTQTELAERAGLDQGDVSRIENGKANPTLETLIRIAYALDTGLGLQ